MPAPKRHSSYRCARSLPQIVEDFTAAHRARFGFATPERPLVVEAVAVEAIAPGDVVREATLAARTGGAPQTIDTIRMFTGGGEHAAPVFDRTDLLAGDRIKGPALIREANATTVVEPGWTARITELDHMTLRRTERLATRVAADSGRPDPVLLELFNNLFMNVAEQTGAVLQNTSMSVNIKERLDFSCAIFDAEGFLVANAPHVPVHLGAMGESVRTVLNNRRTTLKPGDVVVLNNPFNGGTHLPDVTVITPVFDTNGRDILFFVGSRGHHADIGGITPGSTPPISRTLEEEGVVLDDFLLVDGGHFREDEFRALLSGAKYPARSPDVNVADVKAQVAANEKGVQELQRVVAQYGWPTVSAYMRHVMDNAEEAVRRVIDRIGSGSFGIYHGQRIEAVRLDQHRSREPQRGGGFLRHGSSKRGQLQFAAGGDAGGCFVRLPDFGGGRHSAERWLPEAAEADHSRRDVPVTEARCRGGGGKYRSFAGDVQRAVRRVEADRLFAGDDEQLPVRRCDTAILRDDLWGYRSGTGVRWHLRHPLTYDEHAHDRSRSAGTALPCSVGTLFDPARIGRQRQVAWRRWLGPPHPVPGADEGGDRLVAAQCRALRSRRRRKRHRWSAMGRTC